jgi:hypothetical protein
VDARGPWTRSAVDARGPWTRSGRGRAPVFLSTRRRGRAPIDDHDRRVEKRFRSPVPEDATAEPPILTTDEMADRATRRMEEQEKDPLRQPGEMTPRPEKRR